jgi:hypothetical protein
VALLRISGQATLQLLQDFDEKLFMQKLNPFLVQEDVCLQELSRKTNEWWDKMTRKLNGSTEPL